MTIDRQDILCWVCCCWQVQDVNIHPRCRPCCLVPHRKRRQPERCCCHILQPIPALCICQGKRGTGPPSTQLATLTNSLAAGPAANGCSVSLLQTVREFTVTDSNDPACNPLSQQSWVSCPPVWPCSPSGHHTVHCSTVIVDRVPTSALASEPRAHEGAQIMISILLIS
jgi:hypothetical protein